MCDLLGCLLGGGVSMVDRKTCRDFDPPLLCSPDLVFAPE